MSDMAHSWQRLAYTCSAEGVLNQGLRVQQHSYDFDLRIALFCLQHSDQGKSIARRTKSSEHHTITCCYTRLT
jgi:hypothetical protein